MYITVYLAYVAGVRKGRGRELGPETARERGTFLPRALSRAQIPYSPSPLILTLPWKTEPTHSVSRTVAGRDACMTQVFPNKHEIVSLQLQQSHLPGDFKRLD